MVSVVKVLWLGTMQVIISLGIYAYWNVCDTLRLQQKGHRFANNMHFLNTSRSRQNGCHFPYHTFKHIFFNENVGIPVQISLKFVL